MPTNVTVSKIPSKNHVYVVESSSAFASLPNKLILHDINKLRFKATILK